MRYGRFESPFLLLSVVLGVATAACVLAQALILASAISAVFLGQAGLSAIAHDLWLLAAVVVSRAALAHYQETAAARASRRQSSRSCAAR